MSSIVENVELRTMPFDSMIVLKGLYYYKDIYGDIYWLKVTGDKNMPFVIFLHRKESMI